MPKKAIKVSIKNKEKLTEQETIALVNNDTIIYKEEDETKTKLNTKEMTLERENKIMKMKYRFKENQTTEGYIQIKEINQKLAISIETKKITLKKDKIEIEYKIEAEKFKYRIEGIE